MENNKESSIPYIFIMCILVFFVAGISLISNSSMSESNYSTYTVTVNYRIHYPDGPQDKTVSVNSYFEQNYVRVQTYKGDNWLSVNNVDVTGTMIAPIELINYTVKGNE